MEAILRGDVLGIMHLTYRDPTTSKDDDIANVEITEEMIKAGALALSEHDMELETLEEGAIRIFQAMLNARAAA